MYIILGHENPDVDSIVSGVLLEHYLTRQGKSAKFIIPDRKLDDESVSICLSFGLDPREYQQEAPKQKEQYILVDHHERNVFGEIVGVIDHHPTMQTYSYPFYQNENASSTACLLVKKNEEHYTKDEIELAILATMVDTVSFHSSKTHNEDIDWVHAMCDKYGFDFSKMYQAGLSLTDVSSPKTFLTHGLKHYEFGEYKVASSYVSLSSIAEKEGDIILGASYIQEYMKEKDLDEFIMIAYDMSHFTSTIFTYYPKNIVIQNYDHIVSRGRDVIPRVEEKILSKR